METTIMELYGVQGLGCSFVLCGFHSLLACDGLGLGFRVPGLGIGIWV